MAKEMLRGGRGLGLEPVGPSSIYPWLNIPGFCIETLDAPALFVGNPSLGNTLTDSFSRRRKNTQPTAGLI